MASKDGTSESKSLAMIVAAIGRHLDQRERPILRTLETLTDEVRGMRSEMRGMRTDLHCLH